MRGLRRSRDYYQLLKYSPLASEEWDEAIELLTTHETYFFREDYQLRAFQSELLPMLAERGSRDGASRCGARLLDRRGGLHDRDAHPRVRALRPPRLGGPRLRLRHLEQCVAAARRGVYGAASFRDDAGRGAKRTLVRADDRADASRATAATASHRGPRAVPLRRS